MFVMIFFRIFCNMCTKKPPINARSYSIDRTLTSETKKKKIKQNGKERERENYPRTLLHNLSILLKMQCFFWGAKKGHSKNIHATPPSLAEEKNKAKKKIWETGENYIYHRLTTRHLPTSPVCHSPTVASCALLRAYFFRTRSLCFFFSSTPFGSALRSQLQVFFPPISLLLSAVFSYGVEKFDIFRSGCFSGTKVLLSLHSIRCDWNMSFMNFLLSLALMRLRVS